MYRERVFLFLVVVIGLCESLELNISGCVKDCHDKLNYKKRDGYVCDMKCLQDSLGEMVKKDYYERTLPKPAAPRLVEAGWQTIQLRFNTKELERYSDLDYILEVKPHWGPEDMNDLFVVFPYTKIYHNTTQTTYSVKDLEPNTGYQFRVIAIRLNKSSPYSNWSNVIKTNKTCKKFPCGATNIRLELRTRKPYQMVEELKSEFHWKPIQLSEKNKTQLKSTTQDLFSLISNPNCKLGEELEESSYSDIAFNSSDKNQEVYYDCWYKLKLAAADDGFFPEVVAAKRSWIFFVPKCIRINNDQICGCPPYVGTKHKKGSINARITRDTSNNNVTMFLNWNNPTWRNVENFTYFKVQIRKDGKVIYKYYVHGSPKIYQYNKTIFNLTYGMEYYLSIYGYYGHHCLSKDVEALSFKSIPPCENDNCSMSKPNSTCQPVGYKGEDKCSCDDGFYSESDKCIDKYPCRRNPCGRNQKCTPIVETGGRNCTCEKNISVIKGTCVPIEPTEKPTVTSDDIGVIVASVLIPLLVIAIAICTIVWLRKRHKKRMDFMGKEMEIAFDFGRRSNPQCFFDHNVLEDDNNEKIVNIIYVSQDKVYEIPGYIAEKIRSFELPAGSVRLSGMIGRGAFGKVYVGEAQGVNRNPEWTTVAIKTLAESANEEELSDILREIELMKDLGQHENVIQMYGCCTGCRPICLVLEYAPGGNLLNYLRSLKKKCKDIAGAVTDEVTKSGKGRYQKLNVADEMPKLSTSSIPVNANEGYKLEEAELKQAEDLNFEIASRINEEIRAALDPKELESFARQIASGMKHVSGLGIVHRDLAARNILLGEDKVLKISDFGLSREGTYIKKSNGKIPFRWLSIEAIQERTYSTGSDVWAFGVVLWEICTLGDTPYSSVSDMDLKDFLLAGKRLEKVECCTDDIYEIMLKCWSHLPKDRSTFADLSDKLWDLEHKDNTYVNLDSIMRQSIESEDDEEKDEELNQENYDSDDGCNEQSPWNGISTNKVLDNKGFVDIREDMNATIQEEQSVSTNV